MKKFIPAIAVTSLLSFLVCAFQVEKLDGSYYPVIFYPLIYAFCAFLLLSMLEKRSAVGRITVSIYLVLQWLRCTALPAVGVTSGYFTNATSVADSSSAKLASLLFIYELLLTTGVCYVILRFTRKKDDDSSGAILTELAGNWRIYLVFILAALVLYIWRGRGMYTFFSLSLTGSRASQEESNAMLGTVIGYGLNFLVILLLGYCYKRFTETGKNVYMWIGVAISLLRICIISSSSESRMAIIYSLAVFLFILPLLFPQKKKAILRLILILGIAMITLMTIYKTFRAFFYDSYIDAVLDKSDTINEGLFTELIDINFYGVRNIAKNLYIAKLAGISWRGMIPDFVRNIFGLQYLIRGTGDTTIARYNQYIYGGSASSGHLFSSLAYGYRMIGIVFAPFMTAFNIGFAVLMEWVLSKAKHLDVAYVLCMVFIRCAVTMFGCFPMALNYSSRALTIGFVLIGGASLFKNLRSPFRRKRTETDVQKAEQPLKQ